MSLFFKILVIVTLLFLIAEDVLQREEIYILKQQDKLTNSRIDSTEKYISNIYIPIDSELYLITDKLGYEFRITNKSDDLSQCTNPPSCYYSLVPKV